MLVREPGDAECVLIADVLLTITLLVQNTDKGWHGIKLDNLDTCIEKGTNGLENDWIGKGDSGLEKAWLEWSGKGDNGLEKAWLGN